MGVLRLIIKITKNCRVWGGSRAPEAMKMNEIVDPKLAAGSPRRGAPATGNANSATIVIDTTRQSGWTKRMMTEGERGDWGICLEDDRG